MKRPRLLAIALSAAAGAVAIGVLAPSVARMLHERDASATPAHVAFARVPDPVAPAFVPPRPRRLAHSQFVSRWAPVLRATVAHAEPSADAPIVAPVDASTPEGTDNSVLVLETAERRAGSVWVRVRLPILPNNRTGWVPRGALGGYKFTSAHLVVDLGRFRATLYRNGRRVFAAPVGVGKPESPTPRGEFYIRDRVSGFGDPFYGPVAFGTSARSAVLTDWPGGGFVGIHGTNEPQILPGAVSHGCIRLRNQDILRLARLMPIGTPVTIR